MAKPPEGPAWAHEIKLDGYRMHARLEHGRVQLLTRTGLDWTDKYKLVAEALSALSSETAYLDGELCAFRADGRTSFSDLQAATDSRRSAGLVFVAFDLLHDDGRDLRALPLRDRKARLEQLLGGGGPMLKYSDHYIGEGARFFEAARQLGVEASSPSGSTRLTCRTIAASGAKPSAITARRSSSSASPIPKVAGLTSARYCSPITTRRADSPTPAAAPEAFRRASCNASTTG